MKMVDPKGLQDGLNDLNLYFKNKGYSHVDTITLCSNYIQINTAEFTLAMLDKKKKLQDI